MIKNINIIDFIKIKKNINIIDIRSIEKYNTSHIPNAINIQKEYLISDPYKYLKKAEIYYIYCQKGIKSQQVCKQLSNLGFNVINIIGGYENWIINNK